MAERGRRTNQTIIEDKPVKTEFKKTRKPIPKKAIIIILLALIVVIGSYCGYDRLKDSSTMGCRISVYGVNVSWLPIEEAAAKIQDEFQVTKVSFNENGKDIYSVSLGAAGYSLDQNKLISELTIIKEDRKPCHFLFEEEKSFSPDYQVVWDDSKKSAAFANNNMDNGAARVSSEDAYIKYNEDTKYFEIVPAVLGTVIDNGKLVNRIQDILNTSFAEQLIRDKISVTIDTDVYKLANVLEDQPQINADLTEKNNKIDSYANAEVTYTFGEHTEILSHDIIQNWIKIDGDKISLDEDQIREYIEILGQDYNTQYVPRYFTTTYGNTVVIENNEYGYWIDEDGEFNQLITDLENGEPVTRDPVYKTEGWARNGSDDLVGGYVEVNLSAQHIWLYYNGEMVIDSDCVTGQPEKLNTKTGEMEDLSTYRGSFKIAYTEYDATLSSDIYGYETKVTYWMPFVYGQGFHDADWRYSFGGEIYKTDGSHGCVNLPVYVAEVLFGYLDEGFPVIIYE